MLRDAFFEIKGNDIDCFTGTKAIQIHGDTRPVSEFIERKNHLQKGLKTFLGCFH